MAHDPRVSVVDDALAARLGGGVQVGSAFAFLGPALYRQPGFGWLAQLLGGGSPRPAVVSLLGPAPAELPGATVRPLSLPALRLAVVTSDKSLYREGQDEIRLLVVDPFRPGATLTLRISQAGTEHAKHKLTLGPQGACALSLRELPAGDYEARLLEADPADPACTFTVAAYKLVPLVASLQERRVEGQRLWLRARLESFGVPVEGEIKLEIHERGRRLGEARSIARAGLVEATLPLTGEGPHSVNLQVVSDPARTATVPIVGSRAAERSQTIFSSLGAEVSGALLPREGARPVRGIYLSTGATHETPFALERVDARAARLVARVPVEVARVVVLDPSFPARRADALDSATAPHPYHGDRLYQVAQKFFEEAKFSEACALFAEARAQQANPHPYYAYYVACCHARRGEKAQAVAWLRSAIQDGWSEFDHLSSDEDLAALRGFAPYQTLCQGGRREVLAHELAPGEAVELAIPDPMAVLAVGAFVNGEPWEGWASVVTPDDFAPEIYVPARCAPSDEITVEVDTGLSGEASVYLVVKDARLLSQDTPLSRLAGQMKSMVEASGKLLRTGPVTSLLNQLLPVRHPIPTGGGFGGMPPMPVPRAVVQPSAAVARSMLPPAPAMSMPVPAAAPGAVYEEDDGAVLERAAPVREQRRSAPSAAKLVADSPARAEVEALAETEKAPRPSIVEEPEVLYAALIEVKEGRARASFRVGEGFAEYLVEAFVLSGHSWAHREARFTAAQDPLVSLEVPAFLHPGDTAIGRLVAGASSGMMRVLLTRDGEEVPLLFDGRPLPRGEVILARQAELGFLVQPGDYEAAVEYLTDKPAPNDAYRAPQEAREGHVARTAKRVDVPGKLVRVARRLRFLRQGESIHADEAPSIVGLRVLPGLDRPFQAICDATSNYGHACCEQTAAKLLSACAAYSLSERDPALRARAEAAIVAGISRERLMWLPGRGFKMYPESGNSPHDYYGPKAARYLANLELLRGLPQKSHALAAAIEEGLKMSLDGMKAYQIAWPPSQVQSCEDAYSVLRFATEAGARERALSFVRARVSGPSFAPPPNPYLGGAVYLRAEQSFAAAALLRAGGPADLPRALALANEVVKALGPEGRLYSTVDSVAAIALLAELRAANILGGTGRAELNGQPLSASAAQFEGELRSLRVISGTFVVEVAERVEESWDALATKVPLSVTLEREGRPARRISAGESLELRVKLDGGYQNGDLLWVCLPDALSRVMGGGQVKRFSVDFAGQSELRIPLAATGTTYDANGAEGKQRFALCVRNMFEEERAGNPGPLEISVTAPGGGPSSGSFFSRIATGLKGLFSK